MTEQPTQNHSPDDPQRLSPTFHPSLAKAQGRGGAVAAAT
jgi:hypothetical protein